MARVSGFRGILEDGFELAKSKDIAGLEAGRLNAFTIDRHTIMGI